MKQWIRQSFRNRVFASVLLITLVPIFVCNILSMVIMVSRSNRELSSDGKAQLSACAAAFTDIQTQIAEISDTLSKGTVVHSALRNHAADSRAMFQRLNQACYFIRDYCRVDMVFDDGRCAYSTGDSGSDYTPGWGILRSARDADTTVYLPGEDADSLCAGRAVRSRDGSILGYVVFTMTRENIDAMLAGKYAESDDVFIVSKTYRMVYSSRSAVPAELESTLRAEALAGKRLTGGNRGECRYYSFESPKTGFVLLLRQPVTFAAKVTNAFYGLSMFLTVTSFMLCVGYAFWLSDHLAQPVDKLTSVMGRISEGDLDARIDITREDEFGRLGADFNEMTARYKENLETSVARRRELDETQVRMMQAQLNPHFLYNTLDSIKWMGVTNHVPQIAQMSADLGTLLRASISGDEFITLEQELDLIERYLEIQYIRFDDRFVCEIDVPWELQRCMIPKLCLQPIVENAIVHGVADVQEGYIKVTGRQEGSDMILSVTDNGKGFSEEVMELIIHPTIKHPQRHLGLFNVNRILKLNYGEGYGIRVQSVPGQGSTVSLRLPMDDSQSKEGGQSHAESFDC